MSDTDPRTEYEKFAAGDVYDFADPVFADMKRRGSTGCRALAAVDPLDVEGRRAAVEALFGSTGEGVTIEQGFNCDHGHNIHVGDDVLMNFNCTVLDIAEVRIGSHVMLGPGTTISTVNHPLSPAGRRRHGAQATPVTIGDDVWTGANVTILPGVTIGDNVVIAAGAVVTKDVPSNSLVAGVPARILRELDDDVEGRERS